MILLLAKLILWGHSAGATANSSNVRRRPCGVAHSVLLLLLALGGLSLHQLPLTVQSFSISPRTLRRIVRSVETTTRSGYHNQGAIIPQRRQRRLEPRSPWAPASSSPSSMPFSRLVRLEMCQVLGMNSATPTEFSVTWPDFCQRGGATDIHADGWGLAYYPAHQTGLRQFHDVEAACTSPLAQFLGQQSGLKTSNLMAHIRYATSGSADSLANVHPFTREMWGIPWCFCHNGQIPLYDQHEFRAVQLSVQDGLTIRDDNNSSPPNGGSSSSVHGGGTGTATVIPTVYHPVGNTDSEAVFCGILNALRHEFTDSMPSLPVLYNALERLCQQVVDYDRQNTILNFLISSGPHVLWVYSWPGKRPGSKVWNGLFYKVMQGGVEKGKEMTAARSNSESKKQEWASASSSTVVNRQELGRENVRNGNVATLVETAESSSSTTTKTSSSLNLQYQDYAVNVAVPTEQASAADRVCIVATKPLTDEEGWIELQRGELILLDGGLPHCQAHELFRVELAGHGLNNDRKYMPPVRLQEDMRRFQLLPEFFAADGI